ncbi:uncharacterized protein BJ212DRAFT_1298681 [Suillus subaureus]|uniref:Uncharacterized protein n=1 Tax=Suillus subaureus TaxID=48587 RepID=A0A9P7JEW7_9AGAM|nr:uncharacterized protein BJ212DRAFT_1298681 [Suillus subaureus]KAG1818611.1 hypothetical protein BJ212DRAFT_1298681 [Suillus subaureus]
MYTLYALTTTLPSQSHWIQGNFIHMSTHVILVLNETYVVIFKPSYGLILNNQMLGCVGCNGKESHVFFLTDNSGKACKGPLTDQDLCDLISVMQQLAMEAIENPFRPLEMAGCTQASQQICTVFVPAFALLQLELMVQIPLHPTTQLSDALYDKGPSELMSLEALMLDSMEDKHKHVLLSVPRTMQDPQDMSNEFYPKSTLLQPVSLQIIQILKSCVHQSAPQIHMPAQLQTQSSDAMYDQDESNLTSLEVLMLNALEGMHAPVSISKRTTGLLGNHYTV